MISPEAYYLELKRKRAKGWPSITEAEYVYPNKN